MRTHWLICYVSFLIILFPTVNANCKVIHFVEKDESCDTIRKSFHLTETEFRALNPNLDCQNLKSQSSVCLMIDHQENTLFDIERPRKLNHAKCKVTYRIRDGDTCEGIKKMSSLNEEQFVQLNPSLDCSELQDNMRVCLERNLESKPKYDYNVHYHKHYVQLRLGPRDFGLNRSVDVDLNLMKSRGEVLSIVKQLKGTAIGGKGLEIFKRSFGKQQKMDYLKTIREAANIFEVATTADVPRRLLYPLTEMANELSTYLLEEIRKSSFKVLDDRLKARIYKMDFHDFRVTISDVILGGLNKLKRLLRGSTANTLESFENWCDHSPPNDLASLLLDRSLGNHSVIKSFITSTSYDKEFYQLFENWIISLVRSLEVLTGACEGFHKMSKLEEIFEDFYSTQKSIILQMNAGKEFLKFYWPHSVRKLAREQIDLGGYNEEIATRIFDTLQQRHESDFFVVVYNDIKRNNLNEYTHDWIEIDSERAIYEFPYNKKSYVIFRSDCSNREMRNEVQRRAHEVNQVNHQSSGKLGVALSNELDESIKMVWTVRKYHQSSTEPDDSTDGHNYLNIEYVKDDCAVYQVDGDDMTIMDGD